MDIGIILIDVVFTYKMIFLSHSSLPIYVHPKGMTIYKISNTSVEVFHSKMEVFKKCGMSTKKLNTLLDSG